ncbi:MAG: hypothetical protein K2H09_01415 [Treponemataceae bacterium]|nr:hypothetical protein [Treponemataceae bacterium]
MTSGERKSAGTFVLDANGSAISPRLLDLRKKIHNKEYVNSAIQRIAQVISRKLVENPDELQFRD